MKLITIKFEDAVDLSALTVGTAEVTVSAGAVSIPGGVVVVKTELINLESGVATNIPYPATITFNEPNEPA